MDGGGSSTGDDLNKRGTLGAANLPGWVTKIQTVLSLVKPKKASHQIGVVLARRSRLCRMAGDCGFCSLV